ncbi:gluconate 2-dehydrogenase subunit 3 family protein [Haladaptatus sp. DFWS20]|uniref:gluconate 2-dehydrogenase subunit 3 family protein n=1 Tax=Haladaptatus sp. DFWS20 TaxID=3403467 RepID=UPI003EBC2BC3
MELTRRDALAALAASGTVLGGTAVLRWTEMDDGGFERRDAATLEAVARVLYPSGVSGVSEFVETYVVGRFHGRKEYERGVVEAIDTLDEYARTWYGDPYRDLDAETREGVLSEMGLDVVAPDPEGNDVERVRYYVINELLYALYTSPTGGKLVGIENPQGHPGGTESYQRRPQ